MKNANCVIYFLEKSAPGKVEGFIVRRVKKGARYKTDPRFKPMPFDQLDHIPDKLRSMFGRYKNK